MALRRGPLALILVLLAAPAWAVKDWYDYYEDAKQQVARGQCKEALASLAQALRLKPNSDLELRPYGLVFIDYLPHYYEGVCHLQRKDFNAAMQSFDAEVKQGAIQKKKQLYADLVRMRTQAKKAIDDAATAAAQDKARALLQEVQRLRREGEDLQRQGRLEEALVPLLEAQKAAGALDPGIERDVVESIKKIRTEMNERAEAARRAERIERALTEGQQLLDAGKGTEARLKFEDVIGLDPRNARAADGRAQAEAQILASTTRQARGDAFERGKSLFAAGKYDEAREPLSEAAADPENAEAGRLLSEASRILKGMREQKELRARTDALLAEAESLLANREFLQAWAKLGTILQADPGNEKAQERSRFAEHMTEESIIAKYFPNQKPVLTFASAPGPEVQGSRLAVFGVAYDDRGLVRLDYRLDGRLVRRHEQPADRETGAFPKTLKIEGEFQVEPGPHQVMVTAVDTAQEASVTTFDVTRRLRFYETRAFLPSAAGAALGLVGAGLAVQHARRRRALRRRFNPYIAGAPVMDDSMFFGRRKLLARILNVLHHNSLMITGERRIGKTTFLYHLKKALEVDEGSDYRFFPVFTDLQGVPEHGFFHAVMSDVVDSLGLTPATVAALRFRIDDENYDGRDFSHDLQRVVEALRERTAKRVKLALLIDEVDVLNDYSERINQRLRSIFMKTFSEHLVAIMSGVGIKRVWTSEGSPWYNFFDEIELTAFSREEAEALIKEPVEGVFHFEAEAVEAILTGSQLKPYVVQKFCIHAVNRMLEQGRTTVTPADVEAVRDAVQFEGRSSEEPSLAAHASA